VETRPKTKHLKSTSSPANTDGALNTSWTFLLTRKPSYSTRYFTGKDFGQSRERQSKMDQLKAYKTAQKQSLTP
jgi:hypothetical protein